MNKVVLTLAAALTLGTAGAAASPAAAQSHTVVRTTRTVVVHRRANAGWHRTTAVRRTNWNNGRHYGWSQGRHRGWAHASHRTCRTVWHLHQRTRTCRSW